MKDRDWKLFLEDMLNSLDLENIWKIINDDLPKNKDTFREGLEDE
jgi:uncharacterized protein with HEPN domain